MGFNTNMDMDIDMGLDYDDMDIPDMRIFLKYHHIVGNNSSNSIYERMARKIQRAWHTYRTSKILTKYASIALLS